MHASLVGTYVCAKTARSKKDCARSACRTLNRSCKYSGHRVYHEGNDVQVYRLRRNVVDGTPRTHLVPTSLMLHAGSPIQACLEGYTCESLLKCTLFLRPPFWLALCRCIFDGPSLLEATIGRRRLGCPFEKRF